MSIHPSTESMRFGSTCLSKRLVARRAAYDWRSLPQAELDAAYDQAAYAPNMLDVLEGFKRASDVVRSEVPAPASLPYGHTDIERLDWFRGAPGAPVNIFIHGGSWRAGDAAQYHFPAPVFLERGAHFVVPDFTNVLDESGDLRPMARQVRDAIAFVWKNAASMGADPGKIYLSGHSSGAHLAACAALTPWRQDYALSSDDIVQGALYCSGLYDLEPAFASSRRRYLSTEPEIMEALSPVRHLARMRAPALVAFGELETPEFARQSVEFAQALHKQGRDVQLVEVAGVNHFEVLRSFGERGGLLATLAFEQMGL